MKISRGNSDFLKIKSKKKIHAARKMDAGADDKPGYFFTWPKEIPSNAVWHETFFTTFRNANRCLATK